MNRKILEELMTRATRAFAIKDYSNAEQYALDVMQKAPYASSPYILLGTIYGNRGEYRKAIEAFCKARELRPRNIEALNNLGVMYRFVDDLQKAEEVLKEAVRIAKRRPDVYYNLGNVYKQQNRFADALHMYRQALDLDPGFILVYNNMGTLYEQRGDYDSALEIYNRGLSHDPNHPTILYNKGVVLQHLNEWTEAEKHFEKAVIQRPGWVDALNNLGVTRQKLDKLEESEEVFLEILSIHPENPRAQNNLATTYAKQGRNDEAIGLFKKALSASPQYDRAAVNLGRLLDESETVENVLEQIEALYRNRPENPDLAYQYAQALRRAGSYDTAKSVLNPFTSTGTQTPEMDFLLGIIALLENEEAAAEDFFFRARKKMREAGGTEHTNPVLMEARAWKEGGLVDRGIEALEEYLKDHPEDTDAKKLLAEMCISEHQDTKAVEILATLRLDVPGDTETLLLLAKAYQHIGQKSEALETVDELISLQGQRATSDDLNSLNKSLELYEQAVAAYQDERGEAWDRSLDLLGKMKRGISEDESFGAESIEAYDEDSVPVLDFGDQAALIDQDFLKDDGALEELVPEREEADETEERVTVLQAPGSGSGSNGGGAPSQPAAAPQPAAHQPAGPAEPAYAAPQAAPPAPNFMEMVDDPKPELSLDDFESKPVTRPQPPPPSQPQQPYPQDSGADHEPYRDPDRDSFDRHRQPEYPPPEYRQPEPERRPRQPEYRRPEHRQPEPEHRREDYRQPEYPHRNQPRTPYRPPERPQTPPLPHEPEREPYPDQPYEPYSEDQSRRGPDPQPRYPESNENQDAYGGSGDGYRQRHETAPSPAQSGEPVPAGEFGEDVGSGFTLPEEQTLPDNAEIHLEEDFLAEEEHGALDGEAEPDELMVPGEIAPIDFSRFDDEEPELEQVENSGPADAIGGEPPSTDDESRDFESGAPAPAEASGADDGLRGSPFEPRSADSPFSGGSAAPRSPARSPEAAAAAAAPAERNRGVKSSAPPVPPEKSAGLFDFLLGLTSALPPAASQEFVQSGTKDRLKQLRDKLCDAAEGRCGGSGAGSGQGTEPSRKPSGPAGGSTDQEKTGAAGLGTAFALMADLSKVLPDREGNNIRKRLKHIYDKMTEIRKREGLDI